MSLPQIDDAPIRTTTWRSPAWGTGTLRHSTAPPRGNTTPVIVPAFVPVFVVAIGVAVAVRSFIARRLTRRRDPGRPAPDPRLATIAQPIAPLRAPRLGRVSARLLEPADAGRRPWPRSRTRRMERAR